jgi:hypothetical protein
LEYSGRPVVANLVLNVGRGSSTVPLAIGEADESVEAVVTVPAGLDRFPLTAVWDQGLNTPSACHAEVSKGVWVVPPGASHGDPRRARFAGRYRVTYRPLNYKESRHKRRITWRVVPVCDYFACAGRLSSNAGISAGTVRLKANGTYRFRNHPRRAGANCVVEEVTTDRFTGQVLSRKRRTIRRAWVGSDRISLRVLKTDDAGRAVVLQGLHTATFAPTPNSEDAGCTHTYRYKDRVTLTLR